RAVRLSRARRIAVVRPRGITRSVGLLDPVGCNDRENVDAVDTHEVDRTKDCVTVTVVERQSDAPTEGLARGELGMHDVTGRGAQGAARSRTTEGGGCRDPSDRGERHYAESSQRDLLSALNATESYGPSLAVRLRSGPMVRGRGNFVIKPAAL